MARRQGAVGLTIRGQSFLTSGAMLLVCGLALGLGDLVRLGLLLVLGCLLAVTLARRAPSAIDVTREVSPPVIVAGTTTEVLLRVRNAARRRTSTLVATELLPRNLGDRPRFLLPSLHEGEERLVRYSVTPRLRGELQLGPLTLRVRDALGLTTREIAAGGAHTVLVQPRVVELAGSVPTPTGTGSSGSFARGIAASGSEDISVRAYRHGDELRRIHWKATARTGELMVRQEERPTRRVAVVLLDSRATSHTGRDEGSTFEWAVTAAASVVAHLESTGYTVVLVCDETADQVRFGAPDPSQVVLARARLGDAAGFERCVHVVDEIATSGAVVVAVLGSSPDDEAVLAATRHPATRGLALLVTATDADPHVRRTHDALSRRGWRCAVATPRSSVADSWAHVTEGVLA